jgi:uncharacterized membrane protein YccF (DUF307 family)
MSEDDPRRRLLTGGFWAALAFALTCVLASILIVAMAHGSRPAGLSRNAAALGLFTRQALIGTPGAGDTGVDELSRNR